MEQFNDNNIKDQFRSRRISVGLIIMAVGLFLLLVNTGVIPHALSRVLISWPMLLIVIGVISFNRRGWIGSAIILLIGCVLMVPKVLNLFHIYYSNITSILLWPSLLILVGAYIIFRNRGGEDDFHAAVNFSAEADGSIKYDCVFNAAENIFPGGEFKGGKISAVFGGAKIDLRNAVLPVGNTVLKVDSVFGGVTIKVPSDWKVDIRSSCFAGGFVDKRPVVMAADDRRLIIIASVVFGGGTIEN